MYKFTKSETKVIVVIFLVLFFVTGVNISISLRRGRDSVRKNDINAVMESLDTYFQKYGIYPLATKDGRVIGCFGESPILEEKSGHPLNAKICEWGESKFESTKSIPKDPSFKKGLNYHYESDGYKYKFYISLEGKDEAEYSKAVALKNLPCGTKICNYGKGN